MGDTQERKSAGDTDTWQECQKKCAESKHCKFFTWHKEESHWKKGCNIFDTYAWKAGGFLTVSGPRECSKNKVDTKDEAKAENRDKAEEEEEEGYNCEEDGVNYLHRKATWGNDTQERKSAGDTDTWQECQKKCAENKHCKFFTWHKKESHWKKGCNIF